MPTKMDKATFLLPSGFRDLLPPEAQKEETAVRRFLDLCASYGYNRVRPPLVEFEETLFSDGPGAFLKEKAFRFIDPVSQKMMALRFDITAQIARIASSRMVDHPRPLRLMYANDVLRAKATEQRLDRQFRQVGCEIISAPNAQADLEIAMLALQGVQALGIEALTIDVSYTKLLHLILESYGVRGEEKTLWLSMLASKDLAALQARPESFSQALADVIKACGVPDAVVKALRKMELNAEGRACIDQLEALTIDLHQALQETDMQGVQITIDPFETSGFQYHTGLCFTLFAPQATAEIGRGGRYDIQGGQSACGFTLYMDMLLDIIPALPAGKSILVPADLSWSEIKALQAQGWIVLRQIEGYDAPAECAYIYEDGAVKDKK
jgi:ATP phosphoribosyltransferase regulatory subunit